MAANGTVQVTVSNTVVGGALGTSKLIRIATARAVHGGWSATRAAIPAPTVYNIEERIMM